MPKSLIRHCRRISAAGLHRVAHVFHVALVALVAIAATPAQAGLDAFSNGEALAAVRQALSDGSARAVAKLGRANGYLDNPQVAIALPPALQKAAGAMRMFGRGQAFDDLHQAINHAAEDAAPQAKKLLVDAVKNMKVSDAKAILGGGDSAVTDYFRAATEQDLLHRYLPIINDSVSKLGLAQKYNQLAASGAAMGLVKEENADIGRYVAQKALDGLFAQIAAEERAIRLNPLEKGGALIKKVFGSLRWVQPE